MATLRGTVEELLPVDKERKQHAVGTESPCAFSSIHDDLPNQLCVEAAVQDPTEWPALSATEVPVQEHDSTIALFSDIVQTIQDKVDASEVPTHKITPELRGLQPEMSKDMERSGFVYLDITEDVAVFLPAYKLNGLCLKRKKMEVKTGKVKREKPTMTKKKNKQEDEINVPSNIHCHRDTEETPQQDDNAANEDKVNVPSHFFFQRDTDETPQQDVDTSQLLLILSNDVELNPGPVRYSCLMINNISGQVP
ncbi:hypothetical protein DPMN_081616 [Dreissena polymorpha]|uniref:Uncharacterized protein n=1 Tax=Dreissena polymorpha TaxID=45954 RepID=A0A9D4BGH1_DREPO|nr:hypothetical protein DPMN_081616 [Dreissena polymorpha]